MTGPPVQPREVDFARDAAASDAEASVPSDALSMPTDGADGAPVLPTRVQLQAFGDEVSFRMYAASLINAAQERDRAQALEREQQRLLRQAALQAAQADQKPRVGLPQLGAQSRDGGVDFGSVTRHRSVEPNAVSPSPAAAAPARAVSASTAPAADATASITNNQEQGVDEGDIVKVRGNDLIVLRRGRLFSVRLADNRLRAVSVISAAPPGVSPASWYDEMLVDGDTILVTGYGYQRRATEINRFHIDADATITYRDTILLRSGDYYSSRNYASRVVNHTLVLYSPVPLLQHEYDPQTRAVRQSVNFPAWKTLDGEWQSSADWLQVYRPMRRVGPYPILHTVHTCDLNTAPMRCHSRAVLAGNSRSFYVSSTAIYLWISSSPSDADAFARTYQGLYGSPDPGNSGSIVYRFPLGDAAVGAVIASGSPIDQFSFRELDSKLQVSVISSGRGDAMWGPEVSGGPMGLYQIPLATFASDVPYADASMLRRIPGLEQPHMMQNRFVGDYLLYGSGSTWWRRIGINPSLQRVMAHNIASNTNAVVTLEHSVDRIEPLVRDAVIVGNDARNNLHFTALSLTASAEKSGHFVREHASQGETRSHGFFYLSQGERQGMLGLPLRSGESQGWRQLREGSAEVLFLRVNNLTFREIGSLAAHPPTGAVTDQCVASCADWYGNARPIFYRSRVYALMGYELVEANVAPSHLSERSRLNYLEALRPLLNHR
jgi:hypothetical protein